jgi:hypothetical protein
VVYSQASRRGEPEVRASIPAGVTYPLKDFSIMASTRNRRNWIPVSAGRPCPVCQRPTWCCVTSDGTLAKCMRVEAVRFDWQEVVTALRERAKRQELSHAS